MLAIKYDIVIEATEDPLFFSFFSPDLQGFTGAGSSIEDCIYKAIYGVDEHVSLLKEKGLPVPAIKKNARVIVENQEPVSKEFAFV